MTNQTKPATTRRAFLGMVGVAGAAVLTRGQRPPWPRRPASVARVQYSLLGNATDHGVTVASRVVRDGDGTFPVSVPAFQVTLVVGTSADGQGSPQRPYLTSIQRMTNAEGMVRHVVSSAQAATHYYARLSHSQAGVPQWVGNPIEFTTHPRPQDGFTMAIAVGSCQRWWDSRAADGTTHTDPHWQVAWQDLHAWRPDKLWDLGDFHYRGAFEDTFGGGDVRDWHTWARMYWSQLDGLPQMTAARALVVEDQVGDDHEYGSNNCDSGRQDGRLVGGALCRFHQMDAMARVFPYPQLADTRSPRGGLWLAYQISDRVRVIVLDGESLDRTLGSRYGDDATFLGAAQDAWLRRTLQQPAVLNIVLCGKAWIGQPSHRVGWYDTREGRQGRDCGPDEDKVWNYDAWRRSLADWIATHQTAGAHPGPINVVWVGGDRHAVGYAPSVEGDPVRVFPCWVASGWHTHALGRHAGEDGYLPQHGFKEGQIAEVAQYVRLQLSDDPDFEPAEGLGKVTLSGALRWFDFAAAGWRNESAPHDEWVYRTSDWPV